MQEFDICTLEADQQNRSEKAFPKGLVGEIARWIMSTSRKPMTLHALGASLALVSTISGRRVLGPTNSGTALYVLNIAPTAAGKDAPLKAIEAIIEKTQLSIHAGPSEYMSVSSFVNAIKRCPLQLCVMDEFGDFIFRIYNQRASAHERGVLKMMRSMFSTNLGIYRTPEYANSSSESLSAPHVSILGASTKKQFYDAVGSSGAQDGTLNRFLMIESGRVSTREPENSISSVPAAIIEKVNLLYGEDGPLPMRNNSDFDPTDSVVMNISWADDQVKSTWQTLDSENEQEIDKDENKGELIARMPEIAIRIATVIAFGDESNVVQMEHLKWGISLARNSSTALVSGVGDNVADTAVGRNNKLVLRHVKKSKKGITRTELLRKLSGSLDAHSLTRAMQTLIASGQVLETAINSQSGPATTHYQYVET